MRYEKALNDSSRGQDRLSMQFLLLEGSDIRIRSLAAGLVRFEFLSKARSGLRALLAPGFLEKSPSTQSPT